MNLEPVWAVIPAAGSGSRMRYALPKQYHKINHRLVIEYAIERFTSHDRIAGVVVCTAAGDPHWSSVTVAHADKIFTAPGGAERCHSVLNGLLAVRQCAAGDPWILVHDAARPCLRASDIDALLAAVGNDPVGGILAWPVRDTMKRVDGHGRIVETVDRAGLWHALTPQMFRLNALTDAIEQSLRAGVIVTDEAHAMECAGMRPLVVEGRRDNIKITYAGDLALAEQFLRAQQADAR